MKLEPEFSNPCSFLFVSALLSLPEKNVLKGRRLRALGPSEKYGVNEILPENMEAGNRGEKLHPLPILSRVALKANIL